MIKPFFSIQFLRFLLSGGLAAFVNWGSRWVLGIWLPFFAAVPLAYALGMLTAFTLYKRFVFKGSVRQIRAQARDFVLTNLGALPVVWGLSLVFNGLLKPTMVGRYSEGLAHGAAIGVPAAFTFLIYKYVAFRESQL